MAALGALTIPVHVKVKGLWRLGIATFLLKFWKGAAIKVADRAVLTIRFEHKKPR